MYPPTHPLFFRQYQAIKWTTQKTQAGHLDFSQEYGKRREIEILVFEQYSSVMFLLLWKLNLENVEISTYFNLPVFNFSKNNHRLQCKNDQRLHDC